MCIYSFIPAATSTSSTTRPSVSSETTSEQNQFVQSYISVHTKHMYTQRDIHSIIPFIESCTGVDGTYGFFTQWPALAHNSQWQWRCCQFSCHLCWCCCCLPAQSVQWCMQWCTRDCRGAELSWEVVSCAAPLSCPSPSCEAGLLPPSMQGEGTVSKQVQKGRGHQQGRRRRERRCRLTQPTCPLRWWATSHKRARASMCQVEVTSGDNVYNGHKQYACGLASALRCHVPYFVHTAHRIVWLCAVLC